MRERATLLGGTLEAQAGDGTFRLHARLPHTPGGDVTALRVLIADDDDLMRAGLRAVLSSDDTIVVIGEAADGREAVEPHRALNPDVVLMDVRMPDLDGIAATREIVAAAPAPAS